MALQKESFEALKDYLPEGSFDLVMPQILTHKVHLTVTRERQTKLGDYRHAHHGKNHRISVNGNLNRYSFLITLLHELAHLLTFDTYGARVAPHGREWKHTYGEVLKSFLAKDIFPADIAAELRISLRNPAAGTCAEEHLQRVLRRYDRRKNDQLVPVEEVPQGEQFVIKGGRFFTRGEKLRKRIKCYELPGMRPYLFSPLYEVLIIKSA